MRLQSCEIHQLLGNVLLVTRKVQEMKILHKLSLHLKVINDRVRILRKHLKFYKVL